MHSLSVVQAPDQLAGRVDGIDWVIVRIPILMEALRLKGSPSKRVYAVESAGGWVVPASAEVIPGQMRIVKFAGV